MDDDALDCVRQRIKTKGFSTDPENPDLENPKLTK